MAYRNAVALLCQPLPEQLGKGHRPVPAAGAAKTDHQAALSLLQIEREQVLQEPVQPLNQTLGHLPAST